MVGSQIRTDSGGIKVKVFLYNPLVNFLKVNKCPSHKRIQYDTFKQWVTKKRRKVSCLGNQGANHIDSDTEYKPNSQDPKESHRKVDSDTRDAEHGGIPPHCRQ